MDYEPEKGRSTNKTLVIVLSIVGGLILLLGLGCGGLLFWGLRTVGKELPVVRAEADAFLDDLNAGRLDDAYARTAQGFRDAQTFDQFKEFVTRFSVLTTHTSRSITGLHLHHQPGQTTPTVRVTVLGGSNSLSFTLIFVPESEAWKMQRLNIP